MQRIFSTTSAAITSAVIWGLGCGNGGNTPSTPGSGGDGGTGAGTSGSTGLVGGSSAGSSNHNGGGSSSAGGGTTAGGTAAASSVGGIGAGAPSVAVTTRRRIVAGSRITCALDERESVVCWGSENGWASHTALSGSFQMMAMGPSIDDTVCAVDRGGMLRCAHWTGRVSLSDSPVYECLPEEPVVDFAMDGDGFGSLAYIPQGGLPRSIGLLGICDALTAPAAAASSTRIAIVQGHACALSSQGHVTCWKRENPNTEPTPSGPFVDVVVANFDACGLTRDGKVRCWNNQGMEDVSSGFLASFANKVNQSTEAVTAIATDNESRNMCVLFGNGRVSCTQGFNSELSSFALPQGEALVEIAVGSSHVCGIRKDRTVLCVPFGCGNCSASIVPPPGFKTAL